MTLACEDAYSKLVEVVTVSDNDDENRIGNSLLQIWKRRFGHKSFVQALSKRFGQDFEVEIQARSEARVWSAFSADVL